MTLKPDYLNENWSNFKDASVAENYPSRPQYPSDLLNSLENIVAQNGSTVLEIGCGTGEISRFLASNDIDVTASDASEAMISVGKTLPNGNCDNLQWLVSKTEDLNLDKKFGTVVAAGCVHWMDWDIVFPKLAKVLTEAGNLVVISGTEQLPAVQNWVRRLYVHLQKYSTYRQWEPFDTNKEISDQGYAKIVSEDFFCRKEILLSTEQFISQIFSQAAFSKQKMGEEKASEMDAFLRQFLPEYLDDQSKLSVDYNCTMTTYDLRLG